MSYVKNILLFIKRNMLTVLTFCGVIVGFVLGIILRHVATNPYTSREISYIYFIGDLYLRMLKALTLPLIVSSLVATIGSLDLGLSRKIGMRAILYYVLTTLLAVTLGIALVTSIRPGAGIYNIKNDDNKTADKVSRNITTADSMLDLIRNMFPPNLVQATMQQYQTVLVQPDPPISDLYQWTLTGKFIDGMNVLGIVVVSIILGIALGYSKVQSANLLKIFQESSYIMMTITNWVIWISPIGVISLIAAKVAEIDDLGVLIGKLGWFFLTVSVGILFHGFVVLPIIFYSFTRKNPFAFITNMGKALATAFGTASSNATLPVTINCLEKENYVDSRVSRFVLPIGATINMDGTALYEAVAALFIAQYRGLDLTFGGIVAVSITATAASIGGAGIPQGGLVTIVLVLNAVGLPAEDVSLVIAVDWIIDRIRTMVNVLGDAFGAAIVEHLSQRDLKNENVHRSSINIPVNYTDTNL